ncbi:MAG: alpha/beta hydrolase [Pseudomonadales bacterium]
MVDLTLYYATNRGHTGKNRWRPTGYGNDVSEDGTENLRFGQVVLQADEDDISKALRRKTNLGIGDGLKLAEYLEKKRRTATIEAFEEVLDKETSDSRQPEAVFGSQRLFSELKDDMQLGCDVLVYIHGFSVGWWSAVASAMSLELMLNRNIPTDGKRVKVVLFTWPSDGKKIPFWSYFSDRNDAEASGASIGRGFLKLRDYLVEIWREARKSDQELCRQSIHLLCHSMGNYVLQNALKRTEEFSVGGKPPRLFDQVFLCAPDVADDVFEPGKGLRRLPEMAGQVSIYHNAGDLSMPISDHTKGNTDRLGLRGANRPAELDGRVHQIDCTPIVTGLVEHSYYLQGRVTDDIRHSVDGIDQDDDSRFREPVRHGWPNVWRMK